MFRQLHTQRTFYSMTIFVLSWELLVALAIWPAFVLPAPSHVVMRLWREMHSLAIWRHLWATTSVALVGLAIAVCIGTVSAWLFVQQQRWYDLFNWLFTMSQSLPVVAIAPLILLWIHSPFWARVTIAVVITMYPTFSATYSALRLIPRELREVAVLNGATRWQMLRLVEVPLALPVVLTGVQTSVVLAMTGAVVGEYLGGRDGLGALINIARSMFDATLVFVALALLVIITLFIHAVFQHIHTQLTADADMHTESPL
ncbi:MAG: ABC transporter permease [Roseiflexaceae bacterium]|jgi:NitT/TauT family transport system permease protein|nr:ABC transporter permease [Chloroflexaceae bacterium]